MYFIATAGQGHSFCGNRCGNKGTPFKNHCISSVLGCPEPVRGVEIKEGQSISMAPNETVLVENTLSRMN